jgi:hypothetical protein
MCSCDAPKIGIGDPTGASPLPARPGLGRPRNVGTLRHEACAQPRGVAGKARDPPDRREQRQQRRKAFIIERLLNSISGPSRVPIALGPTAEFVSAQPGGKIADDVTRFTHLLSPNGISE